MYSWKVKAVMIMMVFLMTVGFAVLIIQPFLGGGFGGSDPNKATRDIIDEARAAVRENDCAKGMPAGKKRDACKEALLDIGSGYSSLAAPDQTTGEAPDGAKAYQSKSLEALRLLYSIDPTDKQGIEQLAAQYMLQSKYTDALPLYRNLATKYADEPDYMFAWGQSAQAAQKNDEAIKAYRLVIKTAPEDAVADSAREAIKQIKESEKNPQSNNITVG